MDSEKTRKLQGEIEQKIAGGNERPILSTEIDIQGTKINSEIVKFF